MALNKKSGFGFDLEEKFKDVGSVGDISPADTDAYTHTDTHTYADTHTHTYTDRRKMIWQKP